MSYSIAMAVVGGLVFWLGLAGLAGLMLRKCRQQTTWPTKGEKP